MALETDDSIKSAQIESDFSAANKLVAEFLNPIENLSKFQDLIRKNGTQDFGSGETRDAFSKLFQDAKDNGSLQDLLYHANNMRIGRGAVSFQFNQKSNEVQLIHKTPFPNDGGFCNPKIMDRLKLH